MAELIESTDNYKDQSTERGFQWQFNGQRCGHGFRCKCRQSATGLASEALGEANAKSCPECGKRI